MLSPSLPCRCDRAGRRAGLADAAGDHGGAVRRRRLARYPGTHSQPAPLRAPGPAGDHREYRRRRRHDRRRPRGEGGARRLPVRARQHRHPRPEPDALQESALQCRDRLRAGRADRRDADRAGRAQGFARRQSAGVHRLCEGEPGEDAIRLGRRGLHDPSRLRAAQCTAIGVNVTHIPYRGGGAGDAGPDRRPDRLLVPALRDCDPADPGQPGQGDRDPDQGALAGAAGPRNRARAGPRRFRRRDLERLLPAQGHARGDRAKAQRCDRRGDDHARRCRRG